MLKLFFLFLFCWSVCADGASAASVGTEAAVQPSFWSRFSGSMQKTGANAQMTINKAVSAIDYKPYTELKLPSGDALKWNSFGKTSYQMLDAQGRVLTRGAESTGPNMGNIKIEGAVNPEALARYQGQLAEAQARIQLANTEISGIQMKANAGTATAQDLERLKLLQKNVPKYEEAYKSLEKDTKALSGGGSVKQFAGNAVGFAVRSVAIRAGINILSQAVSKDGEVNLGEAVSFVTEPRFWTGSAGAFLGSMLGSTIGNVIFPGGGALLSALPGFLGAAAGYELGSGNLDRTNWTQLFASSAASALAFGAIGGPLGIVASIAAGFVVNKLFDKPVDDGLMPALAERKPEWLALESMQPTTSYEPYASFSGDLIPEAVAQPEGLLMSVPDSSSSAAEAVQSVATENVVVPQVEIDELAEKVRQHYDRYIGFVRSQNAGAASAEYAVYTQYKTQLDNMRARYGL